MNSRKAQASLEYFIIFAVIAGLTLLSVSTFLNRTRTSSQNLYSKAVGRILNSQALTPSPTPTPTPTPSPTPPPGAEPLKLNFAYRDSNGIFVGAGTERVFVFDVGPNKRGLLLQAVSPTTLTDATLTLTFSDGRVFPTNPDEGWILGPGTRTVNMQLRSQSTFSPNLPDEYLPEGTYILTIQARSDSAIWMEVGVN